MKTLTINIDSVIGYWVKINPSCIVKVSSINSVEYDEFGKEFVLQAGHKFFRINGANATRVLGEIGLSLKDVKGVKK